MKGQRLGRGVTLNHDCPGVPYELVAPDRTPANLATLSRGLLAWQQRYAAFVDYRGQGQVTEDVVHRAQFAVSTLHTIRMNLELGICCVVVAIDPDDDILGVLLYMSNPPGSFGTGPLMVSGRFQSYNSAPVATINLVAIDPAHVPGSPVVVQLRGVGTALVAVTALRVLRQGVEAIYLHPLDQDAQRFWERRGFVRIHGSLFGAVGKAAIQRLVDACANDPENAADGDFLFCGVHPKLRAAVLAAPRSYRDPGATGDRRNTYVDDWDRAARATYTPKEIAALRDYGSGYYREINEYLRDGTLPGHGPYAKANVEARIGPLDAMIARTRLPEDALLRRGVDYRTPEYARVVPVLQRNVHALDGQTLVDRGFLSTSFGLSHWDDKNLQYRIRAPKGTPVLYPNPTENEVLLNRGQPLRVDHVERHDSHTFTVYADVVGS